MHSFVGEIAQIIGPVVDVYFKDGVPPLLSAMTLERKDGTALVLETQQHLGDNVVRSVALGCD